MQDDKNKTLLRILKKLRFFIVMTMLVSSVAMVWHNWTVEKESLHRSSDEWVKELNIDLQRILSKEVLGLSNALKIISSQSSVNASLKSKDAKTLISDWQQVFESLRDKGNITHFYFVAADRTCFLRLHLPALNGDRIDRYTMLQAESTGKLSWGIEMGKTGVLTLRVVQPVFEDKQLIGFVELGKEIEPLLNLGGYGYSHAVLLNKKKIDRQSWEAGMKMLGRQADWQLLSDYVVEFVHPAISEQALKMMLAGIHGSNDLLELDFDGKHLEIQAQPLNLVDGREAGLLLVVRDNTEQEQAITHRAMMLLLVTLLIVGLLVVLFSWVIKRFFQEIVEQENALRAENAKNKAILHYASDGIHILDEEGCLYEASESFFKMLGYQREELIGQHISSWDAVHTPEELSENLNKKLNAKQTILFETRHRTSQGKIIDVEVTGGPVVIDGKRYAFNSSREISERIKAERILRKKERDLNQAQHLAKIGSWELDIVNNELNWSDEIFEIFEIDAEKFGASYEAFLAAIHPDDRENVNNAYLTSLKTQQPYTIAHRLQMSDGRIKYVHEQCKTSFDSEGNPLHSRGTVQDVTELSQVQIDLDNARKLLQAVIDHVPMRVFWKDKKLKFLGCNTAFARDAGKQKPEDLVGKDDFQMAWSHEAELYQADDRNVIESDKPKLFYEEPQTTPSGNQVWLRTSKVPLKNQSGETIGVLGIYEDITLEKEKDLELQQHRENLEKLVSERSAQLVQAQAKYQRLVDDMGNDFSAFSYAPDMTVNYVSNSFEEIFGIAKEAVLGQVWSEVVQWLPEDLHEVNELVQEMLQSKRDYVSVELRFMHPDGSLRTLYSTSRAVKNEQGEVEAIEGILTDITAHKRNEAELRQAKQIAESANHAKSAFLANMSHEIRTPMNGVIGMLELLSHGALAAEEQKMVGTIRRSAQSLLGIIDDILDFSKIEAGKLDIEARAMSLEENLDVVVGLIDRIAMDKQVNLNVYFDPALPQCIMGDSLRIRQILTNLAGNAVKFSAGQGHVGRVHLRAELSYKANGLIWVMFRIIDNGVGMTEEVVNRLFQPFEQADNTTTRKFGGTGLGLSISHMLTTMMGGKIQAQSVFGQGSTFTVLLPFKSVSECPNQVSSYDLSGIECLLVSEDDSPVNDYLNYLKHAGASTHPFKDMHDAWQFVQGHTFDQPVCMIVLEDPGVASSQEIVDRLKNDELVDDVHYVEVAYLSVERGKRRKVRRLADKVVQIDREAMTRKHFLEAVAASVGRVAIEAETEDQNVTSEADQYSALRILVAEDNEVNQEVIQGQLEMLGHTAKVADDGQQALSFWKEEAFDLVLTDLHMPHMDGYALTKEIRKLEESQGLPATPIIALTANAMKGEEERCLEQGMDAYLSKPIELDRLRNEITKWSLHTETELEEEKVKPEASSVDGLPVFDKEVLVKMVGNNLPVQKRLLEKFLSNSQQRIDELEQVIGQKNAQAVGEQAHSLKSASRSVGAMQLGGLCEQLEQAGKTEEVSVFEKIGKTLRPLYQRSVEEIEAWIKSL